MTSLSGVLKLRVTYVISTQCHAITKVTSGLKRKAALAGSSVSMTS